MAWSSLEPAVWPAPRVDMIGAAARHAAVVASRQAVMEVASVVVPTPLLPLARANRCVSFSMMMRYRPMRTTPSRSDYDGFPVPPGRAGVGLSPPHPMR
jgi:hypothetical protein